VLDATFNEGQSCLRKGFGARTTAIVRHFALNLVRAANDQKSVKLRRKIAGWKTTASATYSADTSRDLDSAHRQTRDAD
jgi:hypothetical protein